MARTLLTSDTTFYISTIGNNSNDGLSAGTPWATLQYAFNTLQQSYDFGARVVTVQLLDGTYNQNLSLSGPMVGQAGTTGLILQGNMTTWGNVLINNNSGTAISMEGGARMLIQGMALQSTATSIATTDGGTVVQWKSIDFKTANTHAGCGPYSRNTATGSYKISGSAAYHFNCACGHGQITNGITVTLVGTPAFSYFVLCTELALFDAASVTYVGSATGSHYAVEIYSAIYTTGGGLPGNSAGYNDGTGYYS